MTTPTRTNPSTIERDHDATPGSRRWLDVAVLWVAAVSAYALILFLLAQFQMQRGQSWALEQAAVALEAGELDRARVMTSQGAGEFLFPSELLIQFSLVGLAVIALAWTGRQAIAWALPVAIALVSIGPAYWGSGAMAPHPLGEGSDWNLWGALAMQPATSSIDGSPTWPLILGTAVQSALLVLPLVAAPARHAVVTMASAARRATLPTVAVALVALAAIEYPSTDELYRIPLAVMVLGLVVGAVATGAGSAWLRLPAAVAIPVIIGPIVSPYALTSYDSRVVFSLAVAAGALFVVLGTLAAPWVHERFTALRHADPVGTAAV